MKNVCVVLILFALTATLGFAQNTEASPKSSYIPSPLAFSLARSELKTAPVAPGSKALQNDDSLYQAALEIERSLRFGNNAQEARAIFRRSLRLERRFGKINSKLIDARLKKNERDADKTAAKLKTKAADLQRAAALGQNSVQGKGDKGQ